jgi:hypothetical protein
MFKHASGSDVLECKLKIISNIIIMHDIVALLALYSSFMIYIYGRATVAAAATRATRATSHKPEKSNFTRVIINGEISFEV